MNPGDLPIRGHAAELVNCAKESSVLVVIGEAGSGKTTQIPQILLEEGFAKDGIIGVTQPRRVAAISAARRVSQEMECNVGLEVGYSVRFDELTSDDTKIKYLTDGTLLRECLADPQLSKYSVLMLDEAHERSLNTDILFGLVKQLVKTREKPLKVLITSATLDDEKFSKYFFDCPVLHVPGSCFPVDLIHSTEDHLKQYVEASVDVVLDLHTTRPPGDILLFLTGQAEIQRAVRLLNEEVGKMEADSCPPLQVLPLYAALPMEQQALVFSPTPEGCRRCVVATNIAETSITVDGVVYVVDPGTVKQKMYNPAAGMDSLDVVTISRVQATQRAGRAGRTKPGVCYRLYSKKFYENDMPEATLPEIQRTSLVTAVLYLKSLDMDIDVLGFDYLDPPEISQLEDALRQLYVLEAIDEEGKITDLGKRMSQYPVEPSVARAVLEAQELGCEEDMIKVAAMLSAENVFQNRGGSKPGPQETDPNFREKGEWVAALAKEGMGDHILFLKVWDAWERKGFSKGWCESEGLDFRGMKFVRDVHRQLTAMVGKPGKVSGESDSEKWEKNSSKDRKRKRRRDEDKERSAKRRRSVRSGESDGYSALRKALTRGFANRIAHRMALHNGYRPLTPGASLSQVHPTSAKLALDDEGLLPEWIIYHEYIATSRTFLRKVCPIDGAWVEPLIPRITKVDVKRLSGGATTRARNEKLEGGGGADANECAKTPISLAPPKRNNSDSVSEARKRYLARKAAKQKK